MIFKKAYLLFFTVAYILTSCSKTEVIEDSKNEIGLQFLGREITFDQQIKIPTFTFVQFNTHSSKVDPSQELHWNLGNGVSSRNSSPTIMYTEPEIYNVSLLANNEILNSKKIAVVNRYAEAVDVEILTDILHENIDTSNFKIVLRVYEPIKDITADTINKKLLYESIQPLYSTHYKTNKSFILPKKKFTIVPSSAPIDKQFIYEVYLLQGKRESILVANNPLIGTYGFHEYYETESAQLAIFGAFSKMTVKAKYDNPSL